MNQSSHHSPGRSSRPATGAPPRPPDDASRADDRAAPGARPARKLLITSADDLGLDAAINEAVEKAYLCGTLTGASLLVGMPGTGEAARIARRHRGLSVGLHLNLTQGRALGARAGGSIAAADGSLRPRASCERRALLGRIDPEDVEAELLAQLAAARQLDVDIDHLDGHQHLHVLPGVFRVVARVAAERGLAVRIPHHHLLRTARLDRRGWGKVLRRRLLDGAMRLAGATRAPPGILVNDHFRCLFDLVPPPAAFDIAAAQRIIDSLRPGVTEWMWHPSARPAAGESGRPLGRLRPAELALLGSWELAEQLTCSTEIALVSWADLLRARAAAAPGAAPATGGSSRAA